MTTLEMLGMAKVYTVTLMIGTNDVSRGESRKVMRLHDKMSSILEELSNVINTSEFDSILGGSGGEQEGGETSGDQ